MAAPRFPERTSREHLICIADDLIQELETMFSTKHPDTIKDAVKEEADYLSRRRPGRV